MDAIRPNCDGGYPGTRLNRNAAMDRTLDWNENLFARATVTQRKNAQSGMKHIANTILGRRENESSIGDVPPINGNLHCPKDWISHHKWQTRPRLTLLIDVSLTS
jgi:hypothetical protein